LPPYSTARRRDGRGAAGIFNGKPMQAEAAATNEFVQVGRHSMCVMPLPRRPYALEIQLIPAAGLTARPRTADARRQPMPTIAARRPGKSWVARFYQKPLMVAMWISTVRPTDLWPIYASASSISGARDRIAPTVNAIRRDKWRRYNILQRHLIDREHRAADRNAPG